MKTQTTEPLAIAHDYLTQRGGAERVVLAMHRAFPLAPIYTTLYNPETTFPEFAEATIITSPLNRVSLFRRDHRLALPVLAPASSCMSIDADIVLTSSTGWAHGFRTTGKTIVYCHSPARFLYLENQYLRSSSRFSPKRLALHALKYPLTMWDQRAASIPDMYVANSTIVAQRIARIYGRHAPIIFPPAGVKDSCQHKAIPSLVNTNGYYLVVSRLMAYKNVDKVIRAFRNNPTRDLVIIGSGPEKDHLVSLASSNIHFLSGLDDEQMAWAYAHCTALIAPSFEDFGLTPLEAYSFGKPVLALRGGGYLDTVKEGVTGLFFDFPTPELINNAVDQSERSSWKDNVIRQHAETFSEERFHHELFRLISQFSSEMSAEK